MTVVVPDERSGEGEREIAVLVLGMHRSGTSLAAGLLQRLGVDLGPDLMAPQPDNPRGFHEPRQIVALHDRLLHALGSSWEDPRPLPPGWQRDSAVSPVRDELAEVIRNDFGGRPLWGVKDPRLCRLFPLWEELLGELGIGIRVMLPIRHPGEVAASLRVRNRLAPEHALALWLDHSLAAERYSRRYPRCMVTNVALTDAWRREMHLVAEALGVPLMLNDAQAVAAAQEFVDGGMRHHREPPLDGSIASERRLAEDVFAGLRAVSAGKGSTRRLDTLRARMRRASWVALPAQQYLERRLALSGREAQEGEARVDGRIRELQTTLLESRASAAEERERLVRELAAARLEAERERERLAGEVGEARLDAEREHGKLGVALQRAEQAESRLRGTASEVERVRSEAEAHYEASRQELAQTRSEAKAELEQARSEAERERERLAREVGEARLDTERERGKLGVALQRAEQAESRLRETASEVERVRSEAKAELAQARSGAEAEVERMRSAAASELERAHLEAEARYEASRQELAEAWSRFEEVHAQLEALVASKAWRITAPLRYMNRGARALMRALLRLTGASARTAFKLLPLGPVMKHRLKRRVFERSPALVRETEAYRVWRRQQAAAAEAAAAPRPEGLYYSESLRLEEAEPLLFPKTRSPRVSIIIPVYNQWRHTYACLAAIGRNTNADIDYEVIVADDGSTDETRDMLRLCAGVRVVQPKENLGFLRNVNHAARRARGEYLVILNNDTEPQPGWLSSLLNTFSQHADVGLAGSKFVYPDGRLQEAGGIVWRDASAWNYGRDGDAVAPAFNFVRETDYCSGAGFMVPTALWRELGGFDERYVPAYCEDADFAFEVRRAGRRVLYQPESVVVHYEGVSSGTDVTQGVKRYQVVNQEKLRAKWKSELEDFHLPNGTHVYRARSRSQGRRTILVIEDMVPEYDKNAGALAMWSYIGLLLDMGFAVSLLPDNRFRSQPYTRLLQQKGVEVLYGHFDFREWLRENGPELDYVLLARPDISDKYMDDLRRQTDAGLLYFTHDLHHLRELRHYELEGGANRLQESKRLRRVEKRIFNQVDAVLTPSVAEIPVIQELAPQVMARAIPLFFYDFDEEDMARQGDFEARDALLFVGGFQHTPNVDAATWFCRDVLPQVRNELGPVRMLIAGSNPTDEVLSLQAEGLEVLGYVEDLDPVFRQARVFVAPLRYGAGVKGKILTSLRYGVPVVTTEMGNEGIGLRHGEEAMIADRPEDFAGMVCRLYQEAELWERLQRQSMARLRKEYSSERAAHVLRAVLDGSKSARPVRPVPNPRHARA